MNNKSSDRLKILFLAGWYPTEDNPIGGIYIKEHSLAASLYNEVTVLFGYDSPESFRGLYQIQEVMEDEIKIIKIRYSPSLISRIVFFRYLFYLWSIFKCFWHLQKKGYKPDVIHSHIFFTALPAVILGKLYRIPVVVTEHWSSFFTKSLSWRSRWIARFGMGRANMILPVSKALQERIESYGIKNKFCIVPNTVNTKIFYPLDKDPRFLDQTKKILIVGGLTPIKGGSYLIYALAKVKEKRNDFVLDMVGEGPLRKEYETLSDTLGLREVIKFHGLKPKQEVAQFMRKCDFLVLPSLWESLGCTLIEALACGKPVIASAVGGVKEIVNPEVGILVPPQDIEALAQAIEIMLDKYPGYAADKLAQYAEERFGYHAIGLHLTQIYREVKAR